MGRKEDLGAEIADRIDRWNYLCEFGGKDPTYADGVNMNLVRNHILIAKQKCEKELNGDYPQEYYFPTPDVVDPDYMARSAEIEENAKKTLEVYRNHPDYIWLTEKIDEMDEEQIKKTYIRVVMGYVDGLARSIKDKNLIVMRRHEKPETYTDSFTECRKKVENILSQQLGSNLLKTAPKKAKKDAAVKYPVPVKIPKIAVSAMIKTKAPNAGQDRGQAVKQMTIFDFLGAV